MKIAVVRDRFANEADSMTFQNIDKRSPVYFYGTHEVEHSEQPGIKWQTYPVDTFPELGWFDVVDVPELYHAFTFSQVVQRAKQPGKRTYVTVWDNIPYNMLNASYFQPIVDNATGFIARSHLTYEMLMLYGIEEKRIYVVPAAVDTDRFTLDAAAVQTSNDGHKPCVLYAGRITWEKGLLDLMHASRSGGWKLLIAGDGPLRPYLEGYAQAYHIDVEFLGQVKHSEMPAVYHRADVFVYPSLVTANWVEQFGISVIEALACGVPCVTTDVGAFMEMSEPYTQDRMFTVVPPMRWDVLRDEIYYSLELSKSKEAREEIRRVTKLNYSSEAIGARLKAIYSGD